MTNDPATGKPATANPWRTAPQILGMTLAGRRASSRCRSAERRSSSATTRWRSSPDCWRQKRGLEAKVVYDGPEGEHPAGRELIPGMVVAIEQAAKAGLSYHRQ